MWKMWEAKPAGDKPKYKWRHSWQGKPGDDFAGFDGPKQIGRIFKIDEPWSKGRWFWLVNTEGGERLNWPVAGYEELAEMAAFRVETVYDNLRVNKRRAV